MDQYTDLTPEEKQLLKQYQESQGYGQTGGTIGSLIGTGLGLGAAALTGGAALPLVGVLGGAGGAIGGLIGGNMGSQAGNTAMERFQKLQEQKNKPIIEQQAKAEALNRLLGRYNKYGV